MEYAYSLMSPKQLPLMSIIHPGQKETNIGVLIVVGGPQYRVGSHRQFVQLARALAENGYSTMRFDYTGMGDSYGSKASFDQVDLDIKTAIDAFFKEQPHIERLVIWGLCDAASAALIYAHQDDRVSGLVLLNPWLKSDQAMGKAMLKFYYIQRLLSKDFWKKLLAGNVKVRESMSDVKTFTTASLSEDEAKSSMSYQSRMLSGFKAFEGKSLFILSGNDLTAKEFETQAFSNKVWLKAVKQKSSIERLPKSDHTFSQADWKRTVEVLTIDFLMTLHGN